MSAQHGEEEQEYSAKGTDVVLAAAMLIGCLGLAACGVRYLSQTSEVSHCIRPPPHPQPSHQTSSVCVCVCTPESLSTTTYTAPVQV